MKIVSRLCHTKDEALTFLDAWAPFKQTVCMVDAFDSAGNAGIFRWSPCVADSMPDGSLLLRIWLKE